ncbi:MAG: sarcosine oxidase subunit alpha family protein [Pseudomonadota bacterium]
MSRLPSGGQIDRGQRLGFDFDGKRYGGHPGDTLASALLANDVRLVGRSFKYHRPRGILSAGSEEPNALVEIRAGGALSPNTRATVQELYDGLRATSQNRWPSLRFDALEVNDLFSPFLAAGFYYKTFMWPKAFWERVYEPLIRRAAGLGRLSGKPDGEPYDKAFAHCDLLVIGAGPAGLMAALTAAEAGAEVILAEEDFALGGRLLAEQLEVDEMPAAAWAAATVERLSAMANVQIMARTTITGAYDGGTFGAYERVGEHLGALPPDLPCGTFWRIAARRAILAGGAHERLIAFPGNDRPGVMLASAVRTYLNRFAVTPGQRVAIYTDNDDGWRTAEDLLSAGVSVVGLIDSRADAAPKLDCPVIAGGAIVGTEGRLGLRAVTVRTESGTRRLEVDTLAVSGGWNPAVHLTCHMNGRPVWDDAIAAFVPHPGAIPGMEVAGAAAGRFSTHAALEAGRAAASRVLDDLSIAHTAPDLPAAEDAPTRISPVWHVAGKGRAWIDLQNDVTVKDVALSAQENFRSVEHMKRYTTLGMATDQGKTANVVGLAVLAELTGRTVEETGTTTFRPPYSPVPIAAMAGRAGGSHFQPHRHPPSHRFSSERRAAFVEAGLWHRASFYPAEGEHHWRQSCDREVRMVRESVGVCDVTTLGKIDVQGPDAATFLDRVYANTFSTLAVGRVRYGLMLREDGFVMDDGTTARLGEQHYLMTTTTGAAGQVMDHLDFAAQVLWPELDVSFISVTEQWAQFAVAGPKARELLSGVIEGPVDDTAFPFMGCGPVTVAGVQGRLFRISFSGELGYEVAVPARFGASLFRELVRRAEALGGGPYGMEALNVLRIEKGFLTHAELHGRTSADDLGLGRMVSAKKDCIGKVMAGRPGLSGPERQQLVGLRPAGPVRKLVAGAHLFSPASQPGPATDDGYLTSVCFSPALGTMIGLGFLRNGRARIGEQVRAVDLLREQDTLCDVVAPQFVDPEGERLRG